MNKPPSAKWSWGGSRDKALGESLMWVPFPNLLIYMLTMLSRPLYCFTTLVTPCWQIPPPNCEGNNHFICGSWILVSVTHKATKGTDLMWFSTTDVFVILYSHLIGLIRGCGCTQKVRKQLKRQRTITKGPHLRINCYFGRKKCLYWQNSDSATSNTDVLL